MSYEFERDTAIKAVREATRLCEEVQAGMVHEMEKDDRSPVTTADFGSQALICRKLREAFPSDPIVAEEDARELRGPKEHEMLNRVSTFVGNIVEGTGPDEICDWIDLGNGSVSDRFWTLDPIDGTKGFLRSEQYAVALALIENGEIKVGVMACPAMPFSWSEAGHRGLIFAAVRGNGTEFSRMGESTDMVPSDAAVAKSHEGESWRFVESVEADHSDHHTQSAIANAIGIKQPSLRIDSQAKYGAVSRGDAVLYLRLPSPKYPDYREKIWDHAAGSIVVEEAGGKVTDMRGDPLVFHKGHLMEDNQGVVVSNGIIHDEVIEALRS